MKTLKIALDWTPNTNHIGIFIAKELSFYKDLNIDVEILNPIEDNYQLTPGKKLELDICDLAIAPFETVISLNNKENAVDAIAIYAILQEDLSSIVSLKSSSVNRPQMLDNRTYASYKARYEDHIVREMVKNDGGKGELQILYPEKLGIWNTVLEGKADATWIFDNWEGIEAANKNIALNSFRLKQFGIPYGYSPVIIAKKSNLFQAEDTYKAFVKATQKGYLFAQQNTPKAIEILNRFVPETDKNAINLEQSLAMTAPYFGDEDTCGTMESEKLFTFFKWLTDNQLESELIHQQTLFTNTLFN